MLRLQCLSSMHLGMHSQTFDIVKRPGIALRAAAMAAIDRATKHASQLHRHAWLIRATRRGQSSKRGAVNSGAARRESDSSAAVSSRDASPARHVRRADLAANVPQPRGQPAQISLRIYVVVTTTGQEAASA